MNKPVILSSRIVAEIKCKNNNPRNSEGDFALLRDGSILFAYSQYHGESGADDAACNIAGMISYDCGETFESLPYLLAEASDHGVKNIMSVTLRRLADGTLCLFYLCKYGPRSAYYMRRAGSDEKSFGAPECLIPEKEGTYYVINNCRLCMMNDGAYLIPAARHLFEDKRRSGYFSDAEIYRLSPDGKNCTLAASAEMHNPLHSSTGLQEPGAVTLPDGSIYLYFRTDRAFQFECLMDSACNIISEPVASVFSSPESPMLIVRNPFSGIYYSFRNPIPNYEGRIAPDAPWITAGRTPFVFSQSDDGVNYSGYTVIEDDESRGFCYPAVHFINEKEFLISFCFGGAEEGNCLTCTRIRKITLE